MESQRQLRSQQEEIRLMRLANNSLSRDNDAIKSQLEDLQGSLDQSVNERLQLMAQVQSVSCFCSNALPAIFQFTCHLSVHFLVHIFTRSRKEICT